MWAVVARMFKPDAPAPIRVTRPKSHGSAPSACLSCAFARVTQTGAVCLTFQRPIVRAPHACDRFILTRRKGDL